MQKYIQLRIHEAKCVRITKNRQNIFGIPLETDPDSIDISTITTDPQHGLVVTTTPMFLGNNYRDGKIERFTDPKVIAEIPISTDDRFPRLVAITINVAEKDDGAGFVQTVKRVAEELARRLKTEASSKLNLGQFNDEIYSGIESFVIGLAGPLFDEFGKSLGLGDDPFEPQTIRLQLTDFASIPAATPVRVGFKEPNPAHDGLFEIEYQWHVSETSAMLSGTETAVGVVSAALSTNASGSSNTPYVGLTQYRFANPLGAGAGEKVALELYWSQERADNFTTATEVGKQSARDAGYGLAWPEGYVYSTYQPGTVPLELYWNGDRADNFSAANNESKQSALASHYSFVRVEGYIHPTQQTGTVPLVLYWNAERGDTLSTATEIGKWNAQAANYQELRVEGYIYPKAIALRAYNGQYVCAEGGGGREVVANRSAIHEWESFTVEYLGGDRIALRSHLGMYFSAINGGGSELVANRQEIHEWETFEIVPVNGSKIALRTFKGHYLCAENGGGREVVANRTAVREWETFELIGV